MNIKDSNTHKTIRVSTMKKNNYLTVILIFSSLFAFAQNIKLLDEANGFKEIKFNTEIDDYTNKRYLGSNNGLEYYEYNSENKDLYNVFNFTFNHIILTFDKNTKKLIVIELFKYYSGLDEQCYSISNKVADDFMELRSRYTEILGEGAAVENKKDSLSVQVGWISNKIILLNSFQLAKKGFDVADDGKIKCSMNIRISFGLVEMQKTSTGF